MEPEVRNKLDLAIEIRDVYAREILDFAGNPAIEVEVLAGGEIIGKITNRDVQTWYEGFYNSPKHKITMMSKGNTIVGAAYCYYKGYYYIVGVFD